MSCRISAVPLVLEASRRGRKKIDFRTKYAPEIAGGSLRGSLRIERNEKLPNDFYFALLLLFMFYILFFCVFCSLFVMFLFCVIVLVFVCCVLSVYRFFLFLFYCSSWLFSFCYDVISLLAFLFSFIIFFVQICFLWSRGAAPPPLLGLSRAPIA